MKRIGSAMLSLMIAMPVMAAPEATSPAASSAGEHDAPRAPRLKFKSRRPICMCGNGLSEKDIEQAATERGRAARTPPNEE